MRWLLLSQMVVVACGNDIATTVDSAPPAELVEDLRVALPDPDPAYVDYITPDAVVPPGAARMFCYHVEHSAPDIAVDQLRVLQGPHGHHVSVMTTTNPLPPGTFEECTSPEANANLKWLMLTTGPLPAGSAMNVARGQHLVLQFHYVNVGEFPVRVNTVVRLHTVPEESVTTWIATTVASDVTVNVTPGRSHRTFDCTLSAERQLIGMFGHMHEIGATIAIDIGPDKHHLERMMTVVPWSPAYYDNPPWLDVVPPRTLPAGSVIRTSCSWLNGTTATLHYPTEMCLTFMWLGGAKEAATCD